MSVSGEVLTACFALTAQQKGEMEDTVQKEHPSPAGAQDSAAPASVVAKERLVAELWRKL